ncbi:MAG TPA: PIN domain-containing protein [Mycobacteriales bacterium]
MARRLILDTAVLITSERNGFALDQLLDEADDVAIAAITVAELLVGVELADADRRPARMAFIDELLQVIPVQDYTLGVARAHAMLLACTRRQGRSRGAHDLVIAATARATGRTVVTSDAAACFADLPGVNALVVPG